MLRRASLYHRCAIQSKRPTSCGGAAGNFQLRSTLQKGKPVGIGSVKLIEQWVFDTGTVLFQRIILALGIYSNQYGFERDEILSAWSGCFWITAHSFLSLPASLCPERD